MSHGFKKEKKNVSHFSKYVDWKEMKEFRLTSPGIFKGFSGQGTHLAYEMGNRCFQKLHTHMVPHESGL